MLLPLCNRYEAMIHAKPYDSYFGGKSGNGTIQTIINHIPPHKVYYSLYAGNDAVYRFKAPAEVSVLNDLDREVVNAWNSVDFENGPLIMNVPAMFLLKCLAERSPCVPVYLYRPYETFIFLDPPYLLTTRKNQNPVYRHEMTKDDHVDLLSQITSMLEFKIMICCYPNPLYEMWLAAWNHTDFYSTIRGGVALERIYYNYDLTGDLHDYRYLGGDFRERERYKRIKNNLIKKLQQMSVEQRNQVLNEIETYFLNNDNT